MKAVFQKYREAILYIVLLMVLCYAGLMQIKPKIQTMAQIRGDITQKKAKINSLEARLNSAKQLALKLERARIANSNISKSIFNPQNLSLDKDSGYSVLFNDVFQMAKENRIKTFSVDYDYNPQDDPFVAANQGYNVCLMKMKLIGDYVDFECFLEDLYKYPYFISISDYDISPYYRDKSILLIKLGVKVYMKN